MAPKGGNLLKNNAPSSKNGSSRQLLRKGPWTVAEDAMLIEYVKKHGEGNWNAVQRNSRLMRCGKSCRLRWANHLRPNLKKGAFSPEEESLIIELHAKFGNKWARMAAQLPGRTDNEIKNYWNTRLKRRLRAGLPIYPQHMNQPHHHHHHHHQQQQQILQPNSSSSSLSSLLSSEPQNANHNPSVSMLEMSNVNPLSAITKNSLNQPENSYLSSPDHQLKLYRDNNGSLTLSLSSSSPNSPFSSTSTPLTFLSHAPSPPLTTALPSVFGSLSFGNNPPPFIGFSYNQSDLVVVSGMGIELPSIQSPTLATTPTSSTNDRTVPNLSRGYSGLLQDLLAESQALARAEKSKESLAMEEKDKGKSVMDYGLVEAKGHNAHQESTFSFGFGYATAGKPPGDSTMGTKTNKGSVEGINPVDDDLLSLLDNFPLAVPVPNWYDEIGHGSGGEVLSSFINGNVGMTDHVEKEASPLASASSATRNNDSNIGSCFWNNMPDIYEH